MTHAMPQKRLLRLSEAFFTRRLDGIVSSALPASAHPDSFRRLATSLATSSFSSRRIMHCLARKSLESRSRTRVLSSSIPLRVKISTHLGSSAALLRADQAQTISCSPSRKHQLQTDLFHKFPSPIARRWYQNLPQSCRKMRTEKSLTHLAITFAQGVRAMF